MKAGIALSTVDKIFKFLEKEKGEEIPQAVRYLSEPIPFEIAKENLSVTKFNNGDPISEARTPIEWIELGKEKTPGFMRNGNDFHYNHYSVMDERGICPPGWRVPTEEDLLFIKYRKLYKTFPLVGYRGLRGGPVYHAGSIGYYWSSTEGTSIARHLLFSSSNADVNNGYRTYGFSVRCVRGNR